MAYDLPYTHHVRSRLDSRYCRLDITDGHFHNISCETHNAHGHTQLLMHALNCKAALVAFQCAGGSVLCASGDPEEEVQNGDVLL